MFLSMLMEVCKYHKTNKLINKKNNFLSNANYSKDKNETPKVLFKIGTNDYIQFKAVNAKID